MPCIVTPVHSLYDYCCYFLHLLAETPVQLSNGSVAALSTIGCTRVLVVYMLNLLL
jgi:hypothetical protein